MCRIVSKIVPIDWPCDVVLENIFYIIVRQNPEIFLIKKCFRKIIKLFVFVFFLNSKKKSKKNPQNFEKVYFSKFEKLNTIYMELKKISKK